MPRKKAEKPEIVEEKSEEIMDTTPDGQEEAVLSDPDKNPTEGTEERAVCYPYLAEHLPVVGCLS